MEKKLGLSALTALVLSSMLGAGVFSLPQNMAAVASPAALLIGWAITGAGILLLAFAMLILTRIRPELDGGIFTYAREGFGELIGFCSAWGYWLCAVIANVSYLVIVFSALSFFTDTPELRLFGDGNTWQSIVGASVLLWVVHFLVLRGVQTAASINLVATLAKLLPLGLFIVLAFMLFKLDTFTLDFTGVALGVPVWEQVKTPCSSPCGFSSVWKARWWFQLVPETNAMSDALRCWRYSPRWAFICLSPCCLWALSRVPNWRRSATPQWPV